MVSLSQRRQKLTHDPPVSCSQVWKSGFSLTQPISVIFSEQFSLSKFDFKTETSWRMNLKKTVLGKAPLSHIQSSEKTKINDVF